MEFDESGFFPDSLSSACPSGSRKIYVMMPFNFADRSDELLSCL